MKLPPQWGTLVDDLLLFDLTVTASRLDLKRSTVDRLVAQQQLAAVMHGGRWMVADEEIEDFRKRSAAPRQITRKVGRKRVFVPPPR